MLEQLRDWLNGNREFYAGVILYRKVGTNEALLKLFGNGKTAFAEKRLEKELLNICEELKGAQKPQVSTKKPQDSPKKPQDEVRATKTNVHGSVISVGAESNEENTGDNKIHEACKLEADKRYKEVMNNRAHLFALANAEDFEDVNAPDKIQARQSLAIGVVQGYQFASQLYDKADYVKQHGRLPNQEQPEEPADYAHLPAELVKPTLDNKRKAVSKLRHKEQTPERIALIQQHEKDIKILEERWHSLKPKA